MPKKRATPTRKKSRSLSKDFKVKTDLRAGTLTIELGVSAWGLETILGAAYLATDRFFVGLSGDRKRSLLVTLEAKGKKLGAAGLKALAKTFRDEIETMALRWEISRNNRPIREFVTKQALVAKPESANKAEASPNRTELSKDQQAEIDRLIAEVEEEIKEMNQKKTVPDPKGIRESWEGKNLK